ncbi:MAG TPA: SRPBCC family protein [Bacteroidales bacterium]|nr:SRPBCC family protein [Bacteroidales bacterium]
MNILIGIFIVVAVVVLLILLTALFLKKNYTVKREIIINKGKDFVFDYIKYLKNQPNYSKWAKMDPQMKLTFTGTDGEPGFVYRWESTNKNVGQGEQTISKIERGKRIDYDLHFMKPFDSRALVYLSTEPASENTTRVEWGMSSHMKYPFNIMLVFMNMEKMIGNDFSAGLGNLKSILESGN